VSNTDRLSLPPRSPFLARKDLCERVVFVPKRFLRRIRDSAHDAFDVPTPSLRHIPAQRQAHIVGRLVVVIVLVVIPRRDIFLSVAGGSSRRVWKEDRYARAQERILIA
jgi:hypothetical protein